MSVFSSIHILLNNSVRMSVLVVLNVRSTYPHGEVESLISGYMRCFNSFIQMAVYSFHSSNHYICIEVGLQALYGCILGPGGTWTEVLALFGGMNLLLRNSPWTAFVGILLAIRIHPTTKPRHTTRIHHVPIGCRDVRSLCPALNRFRSPRFNCGGGAEQINIHFSIFVFPFEGDSTRVDGARFSRVCGAGSLSSSTFTE